jgi:hypothetical protein
MAPLLGMNFNSILGSCNTQIFAYFKIDEICFLYAYLWAFNIGKIIIFFKIKIKYKASNMLLHSCCCIFNYVMFGFLLNSKRSSKSLGNELTNLFHKRKRKSFIFSLSSLVLAH